jgi:signal transduction histidine kinase/ActR/RegA family two-component response regulator
MCVDEAAVPFVRVAPVKTRMRSASIGGYLLMLALGTLLPVVMFATGLAVVQAKQERHTFELGMHARVLAITSALDAELRVTVAALTTLAESQALASGELERFHGNALRVKNQNPDWLTVILASKEGVRLVNVTQPLGVDPLRIAERASFDALVLTQRPVIGSLSFGLRDRQYAFPVRVPVLREGRLAYVLTAVVKPASIARILKEQGMPEDWVASAVDQQLLQVARVYQGQVQVGVTVAPTLRSALTSGAIEGAYRGATLEGTTSYVTWRRSQFSGWSVGIAVPASTVESSARRALIIGLLGVGLSLVLALLFARLLSRRISEPVAQLAAQARAMRSGDYGSPLQPAEPENQSRQPSVEPMEKASGPSADDKAPASPTAAMRELRELQHALNDAGQAMIALGRARMDAVDANDAKDEFLAMLGHELRNPLSAIATATHLLRMRPEGATAAKALDVLQRQSLHLTRLVDDLLDASRVSRGKIELNRAPLDFAQLVRRVAVQVVGGSPRHQLDLQLEHAWVSGDETRLEQIVTNLLSNAVRYSPAGGGVHLSLVRVAEKVVLTVRDEGIGIAAELLPRVFDLFVQGKRGPARSQGGLGIGLTLAHRLAALHDGQLDVKSDGEGKGSTFTLRLPNVNALPAREASTLSASSSTEALQRLDVLLVDDNEDGRRMLGEILRGAGHRVTEAADGLQAMAQASEGDFDVALIDIGLPGIDGLELARRLRRMGPPRSNTLLVAITGYGAPQDQANSLEAGFDLHVVKPVIGVDLLAQIQRLARRER